jgi:hypothetical protein
MQVPSTRNLIRVTGWIATALLAWHAGVYVARKSECHHAYRRHVGDEWAPFIEAIYRLCRVEWGYLIPTDEAERGNLRGLCERTVQFENHFLAIYRDYLLEQLSAGDDLASRSTLWILENIPYCDERVRLAVQTIAERGDSELRHAAQRAQAVLEQC